MILSRIYLGRNIQAHKGPAPTFDVIGVNRVSDTALESWIAETVVPRFDGFTLVSAAGYWRGEREDSVILEILHTGPDAGKVAEIADSYKRRFRQESVLITETAASIV